MGAIFALCMGKASHLERRTVDPCCRPQAGHFHGHFVVCVPCALHTRGGVEKNSHLEVAEQKSRQGHPFAAWKVGKLLINLGITNSQ